MASLFFSTPLDPSDTKDYRFDWTALLDAQGDVIDTQATELPADAVALGLEKGGEAISGDSKSVTVFFTVNAAFSADPAYSGAGQTFGVVQRLTTTGGRTIERTFNLVVRQR